MTESTEKTKKEKPQGKPEFYTVAEAAAVLNISRQAVYDYLRRGEIPSALLGKRRRIKIVDLDAFIAAQGDTDYVALPGFNKALREGAGGAA